jgi:hypothetical protein
VSQATLAASSDDVQVIACPKCGAGPSIRFDPKSPQPHGSTAGFLMVSCLECESGSALDNLDQSPPWIESLGLRITTCPGPTGGK